MIDHIDHIVLTTRDKEACINFYTGILGMKLVTFRTPSEERLACAFGNQKINLHEWARSSTRRRTCRCPDRSTCALSLQCRFNKSSTS
jgi:catechol 2,3-dioxygenase-like lactoylglutathione lyase family enzyme